MSIKAGLVGLPNVGKSTLFNALTKSSVPAENYPFCTIDPHVAITEVPDERTEKLKKMYNSEKIIPATVTFVDIAGLVKGAASGEGLGNQFLSHIREVDLILHVLRCFKDSNILHSGDGVDPIADYDVIVSELLLKDLESITKRLEKLVTLIKGARNKPAELVDLEAEKELLESVQKAADAGDAQAVRTLVTSAKIATVPLLTAKKFLVIANVGEDELDGDAYKNNPSFVALQKKFGADHVIPVSAKVEGELSQLEPAEAHEMMTMLGIKELGLEKIIRETYKHLGLITFFTCGPKEIHSWPIAKGITIRKAGGEIHSDLERGFICSEVTNCADLFSAGSLVKVKEEGKQRTEGQDYIVRDGDIVHIRFNV
jgi:GTP-binding protein YchF